MDAIEILGSLLGHKTSKPGRGSDVLKDIFKGGSRGGSRAPTTRTTSGPPASAEINRDAQDLEDLLNVANDRHSRRGPGNPAPAPTRPTSRPGAGFQHEPKSGGSHHQTPATDQRALILVRAMVNAAKSDGRIDRHEQESILKQVRDQSPDTLQFLRQEFDRPLDVREFAASVPIGMEQQVYTVSLIAIDLDSGDEAKYMMELANGLRLPTEVREQIHQRLGAPSVY